MAKTNRVELYRKISGDEGNLMFFDSENSRFHVAGDFPWYDFKLANPVICKGMQRGQNRKLKRTQLKKGFKLERL